MKTIFSLFLICLFILSCKNEDDDPQTVIKQDTIYSNVYKMQLFNSGSGPNDCGYMFLGALDSSFSFEIFKPVSIPDEIFNNSFLFYKGKVAIYPEYISCMDGLNDPPFFKDYQKIEILEFEIDD